MWKLILRKNLANFRKNAGKYVASIILYMVLLYMFAIMAAISLSLKMYETEDIYEGVDMMNLPSCYHDAPQIMFWKMSMILVSIGIIAYFIMENPIRLPKMMYLVPTDRKKRTRYIWCMFIVKLLFMTGITYLFVRIGLGRFFYQYRIVPVLVQLGICLFTVWNLILKTGVYGVNSNNSLEESRCRQEAFVNFYWIAYLLLQQLALGAGFMLGLYQKCPALWLIWLAILLSDAAIARYCTPYILEKAAAYEQTYAKI